MKSEYIVHCGVKEHRNDKEWKLSKCYRIVKITLKKDDDYQSTKQKLVNEFNINQKSTVLINMNNEVIEDTEDTYFSIQNYVHDHKKYIGSTRLYLGITNREELTMSPVTSEQIVPPVTTHQPVQPVTSHQPVHSVTSHQLKQAVTSHQLEQPVTSHQPDDFQLAIETIKKEVEEIGNRHDSADPGDLPSINFKEFCPVYSNDPKLHIFINQNHKNYQTVKSGYGDFKVVPLTDMDLFEEMKQQPEYDDVFIVDAAILYFLSYIHTEENESVNVIAITTNVWKLSANLANEYRQWKEEITSLYCS